MDNTKMSKFNLVKCTWKGNENTFAIIKKGWFGLTLIEASVPVESHEEEFFVDFMIDNGQLCDTYYNKNVALNDLYELMRRYAQPIE